VTAGWDVNREWLELFSGWWEQGFAGWRTRHADEVDAQLFFVCELGPPWYAIRGQDGQELSDRWEDALFLAQRARDIWARVAGEETGA
jgi:hypothetical protein